MDTYFLDINGIPEDFFLENGIKYYIIGYRDIAIEKQEVKNFERLVASNSKLYKQIMNLYYEMAISYLQDPSTTQRMQVIEDDDPDNWKFCPSCGRIIPVDSLICEYCSYDFANK